MWWCAPIKGWVVTRYDDVREGLRDARLSAERIQAFARQLPEKKRAEVADLTRLLSLWTVFLDPPGHTRMRKLLSPWFAAQDFERLGPRVQAIVDELVDAMVERGETDLIADLAYPLPARVIGELMGIPTGDESLFREWSDELALFVGRASAAPDKLERAQTALNRLADYFRDLVAERRKRPGEDLVSRLVLAEEQGDIVDPDELVSTCVFLLFAGHETTTNLIANGTLSLLRNPGQMRLLRDDPELIRPAVEELLRYEGPGGAAPRVVRESFELHGQRLAEGERVYLMVNAANRDPRRFTAPERLDIRREPNPHLAFGFGIHFCLGAPLARLEGRVAIATLLNRLPGLALAENELRWGDSLVLRGLERLRLGFEPRRARAG